MAKGVDGLLEIIGGFTLLFIAPAQLHPIARFLTQRELAEDPHDLVANYLVRSLQHLSSGTKQFAALYLLWHGVVKLGLVAALLWRRRWAYPVAIAAFLLFLVYQLYRYSHTRAPELIALSALDVAVIVLTWLEYRRLRSAKAFT